MKILCKLITWPLVIIFLIQSIGWTAPSVSPQSIVHGPQSIYIPESYGKIEKSMDSPKSPKVILVKDAHCNYEAQQNISKILDTLIRDYKIDLIGVEGASGFVNPQVVLESNPKEALRKKVSDKFLKTGLLTASEALSINKGKNPGFNIWGVEDLKLYLKDYQAFRDTIGTNPAGKRFIELSADLIARLKNKIYSSKLKKFDETVKEYELNKLPLTKFINKLYYNYGVPKQFSNLKLILKSIRLEKKIDFNDVEKERANLIKELEKTLPKEDLQELIKQSLLFKLGKIPAVEYYVYIEEKLRQTDEESVIANPKGVKQSQRDCFVRAFRRPRNDRSLLKYIKLVKLQNKINEIKIFKELEEFIEKIYVNLCADNPSRKLHQLDKDINILDKILMLEASKENLIYYKNNQTRFAPEKLLQFIKIEAPLNNIQLPPELNDTLFIEDVKKAIIPAGEFYKLALERDTALVENLIKAMDKDKKDSAVLVCGGFHTDGINKVLQDKGIATITITPSITKIQENSRELYLKRMMDERINPEKMLNEPGIENLGPIAATCPVGIQVGLPKEIFLAFKNKYGVAPKIEVNEEELIELIKCLQKLYDEAIKDRKNNAVLIYSIETWIANLRERVGHKAQIPFLDAKGKEAVDEAKLLDEISELTTVKNISSDTEKSLKRLQEILKTPAISIKLKELVFEGIVDYLNSVSLSEERPELTIFIINWLIETQQKELLSKIITDKYRTANLQYKNYYLFRANIIYLFARISPDSRSPEWIVSIAMQLVEILHAARSQTNPDLELLSDIAKTIASVKFIDVHNFIRARWDLNWWTFQTDKQKSISGIVENFENFINTTETLLESLNANKTYAKISLKGYERELAEKEELDFGKIKKDIITAIQNKPVIIDMAIFTIYGMTINRDNVENIEISYLDQGAYKDVHLVKVSMQGGTYYTFVLKRFKKAICNTDFETEIQALIDTYNPDRKEQAAPIFADDYVTPTPRPGNYTITLDSAIYTEEYIEGEPLAIIPSKGPDKDKLVGGALMTAMITDNAEEIRKILKAATIALYRGFLYSGETRILKDKNPKNIIIRKIRGETEAKIIDYGHTESFATKTRYLFQIWHFLRETTVPIGGIEKYFSWFDIFNAITESSPEEGLKFLKEVNAELKLIKDNVPSWKSRKPKSFYDEMSHLKSGELLYENLSTHIEIFTNILKVKEKWQEFYSQFEEKKDDTDFCDRIRAELSAGMTEFLESCLRLAVQKLKEEGNKPCEFCCMVSGSTSRGELSFVGDIEFAVIPKNKDSRRYVELLREKFDEILKSLNRDYFAGIDNIETSKMKHHFKYMFDNNIDSWMLDYAAEGITGLLDGSADERYREEHPDWYSNPMPDPYVFYTFFLNARLIELGTPGEKGVFDTVTQSLSNARNKGNPAVAKIEETVKTIPNTLPGDDARVINTKELLRSFQQILWFLQIKAGIDNTQNYMALIDALTVKELIDSSEKGELKKYYQLFLNYKLYAQHQNLRNLNQGKEKPTVFDEKEKDTINITGPNKDLKQAIADFRRYIESFLRKHSILTGGRDEPKGKANIPWFKKVFGIFSIPMEEITFRISPSLSAYAISLLHPYLGFIVFILSIFPLNYYFINFHEEKDIQAARKLAYINSIFLFNLLIVNFFHHISPAVFFIISTVIPILWHEFKESRFRLRFKILTRAILSFLVMFSPFVKFVKIELPNMRRPSFGRKAINRRHIILFIALTLVFSLFIQLILMTKGVALAKDKETPPAESVTTKTLAVISGNIRIIRDKSGFYWNIDGVRMPTILGINYSPVPPGRHPNDYNGINREENFNELYKALLPKEEGGKGHAEQLKKMGVETIRIYGLGIRNAADIQKIKELFRRIYDLYGLRILITDFCGLYTHPNNWGKNESDFLKLVETYKDEPWVLAFTLGNENNYYLTSDNRFNYQGELIDLTPKKYYSKMSEIAIKAKTVMKKNPKPIGIGNGNFTNVQLNAFAENSKGFDFIGINNYDDKDGIAGTLERIRSRVPNLPVFFTEYGVLEAVQAGLEPEFQRRTQAIYDNHAGHGSRNSVGGCFFEATDEAWKARDTGQPWQARLGILDKGINPFKIRRTQHKAKNLKAPGSKELDKKAGSDSMDEDRGEREYIEKQIANSPLVTSSKIKEAIALIPDNKPPIDKIAFHTIDLGEQQFGIPRFDGATKPQDLIYAYGRKESDQKLHIYVTKTFWDKHLLEDPIMLAFLIDHEWQENMLDKLKSHREASQRAWYFVDEIGMNPFYRFYIDRLADEEDIESLKKLLEEHLNDKGGKFRSYVLETLMFKMLPKLQDELEIIRDPNGGIIEENYKEAEAIFAKLKGLHTVIKELMTENGMASSLVYEKLENILHDMLRKGNMDAKVNLMCIALPIALLNSNPDIGLDVANKVKKKFYEKVKEHFENKPHTQEDGGARFAYDDLSGQYYGISQTRLYIVGFNEDDFSSVKTKFAEVLTDPEIGIKTDDVEKYPLYAGHMLVGLPDTVKTKYKMAEDLETKNRKRHANKLSNIVSRKIRKLVIDSIREVTGRTEAVEKSEEIKSEELKRKGILGQSHIDSWRRENNMPINIKSAIEQGRNKTIPEGEYETGKIPRLGHAGDHPESLLKKIIDPKTGRIKKSADLGTKCDEYLENLNKYTLQAFQDKRYKKAYKKHSVDTVIMAWQDKTLSSYINWLKTNGMPETASSWEDLLKMTKLGDEIWSYLKIGEDIHQIFGELDKFNAFNEQYPADVKDYFYHQILDSFFILYQEMQKGGDFTLENFKERIRDKIANTLIRIPKDKPYRKEYMPKSKPAEVDWYDADRTKHTENIEAENVLEKPIKMGNKIPLKELRFHHTEKIKDKRLPVYLATKNGRADRRVVIYERRIFTLDGKEDITEELMRDRYRLSPFIAPLDITITTDFHSLAKLDPYILSKINMWQKRNTTIKVADASEIITLWIISILEKHEIKINNKDDLEKDLHGALVHAYKENLKIDFMELWGLLKNSAEIDPKEFFTIAADISKPLNTLLGNEAKTKGAQIVNAILKEILKQLQEEQEIAQNKKLTDEEKLLKLIKKTAEKKGVDPNAVQSIFDLFKQGTNILAIDPGLDIGKIDGSYFTLIEEFGKLVSEITGISEGAIRNAFKHSFGIDAHRADGQIIEGSTLWKEAERLKEYNKPDTGKYNLAEVKDKLWDSDFRAGTVLDEADNNRNRYLSALDAVSKDADSILRAIGSGSVKGIVESPSPVGIIYHIEDYIAFNDDGTFSYKPGIEAVFKKMNGNIKIAFITPNNLKARAETALEATGKFGNGIFLAKDFKDAKEEKLKGIVQNNIVYVSNELEADKPEFRNIIKGLKTIVTAKDSAFHATLVFAVLYARAGTITIDGIINPEVNALIWHFLKLMDYKDERIQEVVSELRNKGFFTVQFIRAEKTLEEFQKRKIIIDVAA